jgi:hypothetical protein
MSSRYVVLGAMDLTIMMVSTTATLFSRVSPLMTALRLLGITISTGAWSLKSVGLALVLDARAFAVVCAACALPPALICRCSSSSSH